MNVRKLRKINRACSIQPTFFKLGEYNLLLSILTLRFINCVKFNFGKGSLSSDSHQDGAENLSICPGGGTEN